MSASNYQTLGLCLADFSGVSDHAFGRDDLRIVGLSAALLGGDDKVRLRLLEASGDNALSMAVATRCLRLRCSAQTYQEARSVVTSNRGLAALFVTIGLNKFVTFVAGVMPESRAGADALEAMVGLVYFELGMPGVMKFCETVSFFDGYTRW